MKQTLYFNKIIKNFLSTRQRRAMTTENIHKRRLKLAMIAAMLHIATGQ